MEWNDTKRWNDTNERWNDTYKGMEGHREKKRKGTIPSERQAERMHERRTEEI